MRCRAFVMVDVLLSMLLLGVMMTLLAAGLSGNHRAQAKLRDTQKAEYLAESALCDLQQGKSVHEATVEKIAGGTEVSSYVWVRVSATVSGRTATLTGLARADAIQNKDGK